MVICCTTTLDEAQAWVDRTRGLRGGEDDYIVQPVDAKSEDILERREAPRCAWLSTLLLRSEVKYALGRFLSLCNRSGLLSALRWHYTGLSFSLFNPRGNFFFFIFKK